MPVIAQFFERPFPLQYVAKLNLAFLEHDFSVDADGDNPLVDEIKGFCEELRKLPADFTSSIYIDIFKYLIYFAGQDFKGLERFRQILMELHAHLWNKFFCNKSALVNLMENLVSDVNYRQACDHYLKQIIPVDSDKRINFDTMYHFYRILTNEVDKLLHQNRDSALEEKLNYIRGIRGLLLKCYAYNEPNDYISLKEYISTFKNNISDNFLNIVFNQLLSMINVLNAPGQNGKGTHLARIGV